MKKITSYLTFAGTIPFFITNILLIFNINIFNYLFDLQEFLKIYVLIIISFMAGVHWGQHLHINEQKWCYYLPILSNIIALSAWIIALLLDIKILLFVLGVLFLFLLMIDIR